MIWYIFFEWGIKCSREFQIIENFVFFSVVDHDNDSKAEGDDSNNVSAGEVNSYYMWY